MPLQTIYNSDLISIIKLSEQRLIFKINLRLLKTVLFLFLIIVSSFFTLLAYLIGSPMFIYVLEASVFLILIFIVRYLSN